MRKTTIRKVFGLLAALALFATAATAHASMITWTVTGEVGGLAHAGTSDDEMLVGAMIEMTITVDSNVPYADWFGLGFIATAHIASGSIAITGSGRPENNTTLPFLPAHPLFPSEPYGFVPSFANVNNVLFPTVLLPSGNMMDLAHNFPPTPTGGIAVIGGTVTIADFPVGQGFLAFNPTVFSPGYAAPIGEYQSTTPTASASESSDGVVPEPATTLLMALGLAGLGWSRRKLN